DPSLAHHISHRYAHLHRENLHIFDDAIEILEGIRAAGYATAMITNGPRPLQRDKIERFGFAPYFDLIVIEGEFGHGKPHRAVFEHAVATFGVEPARAWHIGDNLYADISGAQAVGLHATWIHRDRLKLDPDPIATPDRAIATLRELREPLGI
ncbi:MAG: HAD family hydrolase, partial [Tepidiformaceae bacterium]